ncbi:hypothetical protein HHI36_006712 [Cryptolaemus montrouzieri]|uniref:Uncharacterized protein n=1 Tax=Cryptolaemus montrouzieri TaxID=559131 RepID=A0ABD2NXW1_9CUCU
MLEKEEMQSNLLSENQTLKNIIQNEFEEEFRKLLEENCRFKDELENLKEELNLKDMQLENVKVKMRQLEDEYILNETQLEDKVAEKEQSIRDLKLKLVEKNQTSGTINPNMEVKLKQELTQRKETIVFLKEKLENQKQSIENHARHLAHRSHQSEAMLADIEERVDLSGSCSSPTVLETGARTKSNSNADEKQFVEINRRKSISVRESVNDNTNATPALECIRPEQLNVALIEIQSKNEIQNKQNTFPLEVNSKNEMENEHKAKNDNIKIRMEGGSKWDINVNCHRTE